MDEFSIIDLIADALGAKRGVYEGVGDDATVLPVPEGEQLVVSTDTLVAGTHFEHGTPPGDVGYKALAANLSDLAAMGARPAWFLMALTLPEMDADWVRDFTAGMVPLARDSGILLVGGNVTSGPLNVSITVCGLARPGEVLTRSGAQAGDLVGISGPTGLAAYALLELRRGREPAPACAAALRRPEPRLAFGRALVGRAHACIDISDGLFADLGHVAEASGVGARIDLARLTVPPELADLADAERWDLQLGGGDDYELCFTAAPDAWETLAEQVSAVGGHATVIGEITATSGCEAIAPDGSAYTPERAGYVHGVQRSV